MVSRFEQFTVVISAIYRQVQIIERIEMEKHGLKGGFVQYLAVLNRHPDGLTSSQLCDICVLDKAAVSRAVNEMEDKGLVYREGTSYRAKIKLTESGEKAARFVAARTAEAVALAEVSPEMRDALYDSLEHISDRLRTIIKEGFPEQ